MFYKFKDLRDFNLRMLSTTLVYSDYSYVWKLKNIVNSSKFTKL